MRQRLAKTAALALFLLAATPLLAAEVADRAPAAGMEIEPGG